MKMLFQKLWMAFSASLRNSRCARHIRGHTHTRQETNTLRTRASELVSLLRTEHAPCGAFDCMALAQCRAALHTVPSSKTTMLQRLFTRQHLALELLLLALFVLVVLLFAATGIPATYLAISRLVEQQGCGMKCMIQHRLGSQLASAPHHDSSPGRSALLTHAFAVTRGLYLPRRTHQAAS